MASLALGRPQAVYYTQAITIRASAALHANRAAAFLKLGEHEKARAGARVGLGRLRCPAEDQEPALSWLRHSSGRDANTPCATHRVLLALLSQALKDADVAVELEPGHLKGLFRRASWRRSPTPSTAVDSLCAQRLLTQ